MMQITVRGLPVTLTDDTIAKTRQYYIDNANQCINDAIAGVFYVNDLEKYIFWQKEMISRTTAGESDHTFTFIQMAYYLQSGECVALL